MSGFETERHALGLLPTRRPPIVCGNVRGSIEPQTGDDSERVAVARVNRDPFATTTRAKPAKFGRAQWRLDQTCPGERIRNGPRTIVTIVVKRMVTAAITVRLGTKLIGRPNRAFDCQGRSCRSRGLAKTKLRPVTGNGRTRRRKRVRDCRWSDRGKNSRA